MPITTQSLNLDRFFKPSPLRFDEHGLIQQSKVWRSDGCSLDALKLSNGFQARGTDTNLNLHVLGYSTSAYIGFGCSLLDATKFCRPVCFKKSAPFFQLGSHLYKTNLPKIYVDIKKSYAAYVLPAEQLIGHNFAEIENEIAAPYTVPFQDIQKARRYIALPGLGVPFIFIGELMCNPYYQPRNWAINIPSASTDEARFIESLWRGTPLLNQNKRLIHLPEATQIATALEKAALNYKLPENPRMIIFDQLNIDLNEQQGVDNVVKQYHQFAKLYAEPVTMTLPIFFNDIVSCKNAVSITKPEDNSPDNSTSAANNNDVKSCKPF